jgi:hypothetical protein
MIRLRRKSVRFHFLDQVQHPAPGMKLENNGSMEDKGSLMRIWIILAISAVVGALLAQTINPH